MKNKTTRTFNSVRNISIGVVNQFVITVLSFVIRTIFINTLGVEYLGVNGLFYNILNIFSLAELGIGNAIVYALYKPISENNEQKIAALVRYYKKLYNCVAVFVAVAGMALIPFLPLLVKTEKPINHITLFYVLYLTNSVFSYLCAYKAAIINADQKMYIVKVYSFVFSVIQTVLQAIILIFLRNFICYIAAQIICTLLSNIFISKKANNLYPYIKSNVILDNQERKDIFKNIKSLFLYKLGGVILNNTDNILISVMIGTVWVGYYSNYNVIIYALLAFIGIIFTSVNASVGNLNATSDALNKYRVFNILNFLAFWIAGFASVCLFVLLKDFITLWLGKEYVFGSLTEFAVILNFYIVGIIQPVWVYRESTGFFNQTKYVFMCTAALNIILSVILGRIIGIGGVLLATAVSRLCTNFWYEPLVLYRMYFKQNVLFYLLRHLLYLLITLFAAVLTWFATLEVSGASFAGLIIKGIICLLIPNTVFCLALHKTYEFQYFKNNFLDKLLRHMVGIGKEIKIDNQ